MNNTIYGGTTATPTPLVNTDQTYNPESENAQSGKAIHTLIGDLPTDGPEGEVKNLVDYVDQLRRYCFEYTDSMIRQSVGDIEIALDNIIAIQNELMGGDSV